MMVKNETISKSLGGFHLVWMKNITKYYQPHLNNLSPVSYKIMAY